MAAQVELVGVVETGESFTVAWSKISGPGTVTFSHSTSLRTEATLSAAGEYVLRLTVTTADFEEFDQVTITATANAAPDVSAGADITVMQNTNAQLVGSYEDDGFPSLEFWYDFSSTVLGTPGTGTFRLGHATQASSTQMNIAVTDRFGVNRQADLLSIPSGSVITLTDRDAPTRTLTFTCGTPTLFGGFVFWSMSSVSVSTANPMRNGFAVEFTPTKTPTITWSMTAGTGSATFGSANALESTVSFSATGSKTIQLAVSDGVLTGTDTLTVDVDSVLGTDLVRAQSQAIPGSADLTGPVVFMIDMSRFPVGWWNAAAAASDTTGRTVRVCYAGTTTQVPFDIINFNGTADTGFMTVGSYAFAAGTGFDIYVGNSAFQLYAATDTYGRYNVYRTAMKGFWPNGGGFDRTRNINSLVNFGTPTVGAGPIGSSSTLYSSTTRAALLLPAAVVSPISFFAASDTTATDFTTWYHTIGISRTKAGTLDSYNNAVYMAAAGATLHATISSLNGSGVWQSSSAQCTAQTWKGQGGVHASNTSRLAATAQATGSASTVNNAVIELDHLCIGHFPKLLGGPGTITNPKVSLCCFWNEAVNVNELKYLDLMLTQATFWGTWTLNP